MSTNIINELKGPFLLASVILFLLGIIFAKRKDYKEAYWLNVLALLAFGVLHHMELYL